MSGRRTTISLTLGSLLLALALPMGAAAQSSPTTCRMNYEIRGWSLAVKSATGSGTITCDNGQTADVRLRVKGAGLTAGRYAITDGHGKFSAVNDIRDLFGDYAATDVAAGVEKEREGVAMTKGSVSLALAGKGTGFDLGAAVEKFSIHPLRSRR